MYARRAFDAQACRLITEQICLILKQLEVSRELMMHELLESRQAHAALITIAEPAAELRQFRRILFAVFPAVAELFQDRPLCASELAQI